MTFSAIWDEFWYNMLSFFYTYSHVNYIVWTAHNPPSCFKKNLFDLGLALRKCTWEKK